MPKRPVTPPIDDGAKYLTVVYPYPARPDMELEEHRKLFAQWVAACIGLRYLRAFYYKPSSPGSIIVEVDESFPQDDFKRLLGAHKWSEFLKEPKKDQRDSQSKVFYCTYHSDRVVQKNGWKRIDIQESWFRNQTKASSKFVTPYPDTHWCDIPKIGDIIQNDLCHPLPAQVFPQPPQPAPAPVVGTPEWQEWRSVQASTHTLRVWKRGESINAPPASRPSSTPITRTASAPAQQAVRTNCNSTAAPPGLSSPGSSSGSSNSSRVPGTALGTRVTNRSVSPLDPASSDASSNNDAYHISAFSQDPHGQVAILGNNIASAFAELTLGDEIYEEDNMYSVDGIPADGDPHIPGCDAARVDGAAAPVGMEDSLWGDYVGEGGDLSDNDDDDDDDRGFAKASAKNPELCHAHNVVCAKGICQEYAQQLRKKRDLQRKMEREEAIAKRKNRGDNKGRKKNSFFKDETSGDLDNSQQVRSPPSHLRPAAPAGPIRQLPPHLTRGTSIASAPASPAVAPLSGGRVTPTSSRHLDDDADAQSSGGDGGATFTNEQWGAVYKKASGGPPSRPQDDDASSQSSGRWGTISTDNPWGPVPKKAPAPVSYAAPGHKKGGNNDKRDSAAGAAHVSGWGRVPSISASADDDASSHSSGRWGSISTDNPWGPVPKNNDPPPSHTAPPNKKDGKNQNRNARAFRAAAPAPGVSAWGRAPSISASSVQRNNDSWSASGRADDARSVAASEATGWGSGADAGPWGSTEAVRAASHQGANGGGKKVKKTWAEQIDEADVRSGTGSTLSSATWGNVSVGPW